MNKIQTENSARCVRSLLCRVRSCAHKTRSSACPVFLFGLFGFCLSSLPSINCLSLGCKFPTTPRPPPNCIPAKTKPLQIAHSKFTPKKLQHIYLFTIARTHRPSFFYVSHWNRFPKRGRFLNKNPKEIILLKQNCSFKSALCFYQPENVFPKSNTQNTQSTSHYAASSFWLVVGSFRNTRRRNIVYIVRGVREIACDVITQCVCIFCRAFKAISTTYLTVPPPKSTVSGVWAKHHSLPSVPPPLPEKLHQLLCVKSLVLHNKLAYIKTSDETSQSEYTLESVKTTT